jgi:hypothetical protein
MAHSPVRAFGHTQPRDYSLDELVVMPMNELLTLCIRWRLQLLSPRLDSQQRQAHANAYDELHQDALLCFIKAAWRRPTELEKTAARRDERMVVMQRSLLLSATNTALYYAGFEEPFAFKSAIWRQVVVNHLDQVRVFSGARCLTDGSSTRQARKSCKPLVLIDMRTPPVIDQFLCVWRSSLIMSIQEAMNDFGLSLSRPEPAMNRKRLASEQEDEQPQTFVSESFAVAVPCYWCENDDIYSQRRRRAGEPQYDVTDYCGDDMLPRGTLVCSPSCVYWAVYQLWGPGQAIDGLAAKLCEEYNLQFIEQVPRRPYAQEELQPEHYEPFGDPTAMDEYPASAEAFPANA